MKLKKNYNYSDVDMLMAALAILEFLKTNLLDFSLLRTDWTLKYITDLITKIKKAIETQLGIDARKSVRHAMASINQIKIPAKNKLSLFKAQIQKDFKKDTARRDEILITLGFPKHLKGVQQNKNQPLIMLLYTFKTNMSAALRLEITTKGMSAALIDSIVAYAENFTTANLEQETSKTSSNGINNEIRDSFNSIYDEAIGICKTASTFYNNNPAKKVNFIFSRVINKVKVIRKSVENVVTNEPILAV